MSFSLSQLTEGIKSRNVGTANRRLLEKWGRTGLLRGLEGVKRENMATMLENQAGQALREASNLGAGDSAASSIRGFTNIAFPIVRRVFGGLIANELVSIQPMSLPSGLLFYLDYTYGSDVGADGDTAQSVYSKGQSIYGSPTNPKAGAPATAVGGQYDLAGAGYSKHGAVRDTTLGANGIKAAGGASTIFGAFSGNSGTTFVGQSDANDNAHADSTMSASNTVDLELLQYDPQLLQRIADGSSKYRVLFIRADQTTTPRLDTTRLADVAVHNHTDAGNVTILDVDSSVQGGAGVHNVRRLTKLVNWDGTAAPVDAPNAVIPAAADWSGGPYIMCIVRTNGEASNSASTAEFSHPQVSDASAADLSTVVAPLGESDFSGSPAIPEIDIKIESVSVVAETRKLRAKWSPELAQDLNAYHSLDAEVELTQILSEQVALEIDREILGDLLRGAEAANFFWSRAPGKFVNKRTGKEHMRSHSTDAPGPVFAGTAREWYETLIETIIDVANEIHRRTLRGAANFIVVSPEVATILEASVLYKPALSLDSDGQVASPMSIGAEAVGTLSSRFTVYKDPYFPRNKILVGFKGGSYLETGYVYAPYVPLIVTPTIFQPEDFTPRKGVMTRYGKKMVRGDFYGTVTCLDMDII